MISFSRVSKRYPGGHQALQDVSFSIDTGELVFVTGHSGAGKSTLLKLLNGLLRPDAGVVRVLGVDLWQDPAAAKALIGILADGMRLFDRLSGRVM
mgnify:CR=1 FL=1